MKLYYAFIKTEGHDNHESNKNVLLFSVNIDPELQKKTHQTREKLASSRITYNEIINNTLLRTETSPIFVNSHNNNQTMYKSNIILSFNGYKLLKSDSDGFKEDVGCTYFTTTKLRFDEDFYTLTEIIKSTLDKTIGTENYTYEGEHMYYQNNSNSPDPYDDIYHYVDSIDTIYSTKNKLEQSLKNIKISKKNNKL